MAAGYVAASGVLLQENFLGPPKRALHTREGPMAEENATPVTSEKQQGVDTGDTLSPKASKMLSDAKTTSSGMIDDRIVCYHAPHGDIAQYYKEFRDSIMIRAKELHKALLFSSARQGEGKSITALNFAVAVCQDLSLSILVVDCNVRQPGTHLLLGLEGGAGLSEILQGEADAGETIVPTSVDRLSFMPAGKPPRAPAELLKSENMNTLLDQLRSEYDLVILDAAPVLFGSTAMPRSEASILAEKADGVVLVVEAGSTSRTDAGRAAEILQQTNLLGFVLNRSEFSVKESPYG